MEKESFDEILEAIGYKGVVFKEKVSNKAKLHQSICFKVIIEPRLAMIEQLKKGLSIMGVLAAAEQHPELFKIVFTPTSTAFVINPSEFLDSVHVVFSAEGSNKRENELQTYKCFSDLVETMDQTGKCFEAVMLNYWKHFGLHILASVQK